MDREKILDKARKLKALAGSSNPHEAKLALSRMQLILAKNGLTERDLSVDKFGRLHFEYNGQPWARNIIGALAHLYFCKVVYRPSRSNKAVYALIGTSVNTDVVQELALSILDKVHYEARQSSLTNSEITSFRTGASYQIMVNCGELVKKAKESGIDGWDEVENGGEALVVGDYYEKNEAEIDKWMKDNIGITRTEKARRAKVESASFERGKLYGGTLDLQKKVN
jgi:hypothetical protein